MTEMLEILSKIGADYALVIIMVTVGYLSTDRANLHKCGLFPFLDKVHWVFIVSAIVGTIYIIAGEKDWETAFISYLVANLLYSHLLKKVLSFINSKTT